MESLNKFKVLTIVIICMFVFVVAAIYSNTKDATGKVQMKSPIQIEQDNKAKENAQAALQNTDNLAEQIEFLNRRIDELSERVNNNSSTGNLNCHIVGTMGDNGLQQLTEDAAIQDARDNGNELVVACSF